MRLLKTHSRTSERLGYAARKNAKKTIEGTGLPRPCYNKAVLHRRSIPSVGVWGLEFLLFCIIGYETEQQLLVSNIYTLVPGMRQEYVSYDTS